MSNISLYRILYYHLPHALRMSRTLGWLRLSVTYPQLLMLRWDQSMLEARRLAYMTPQVCYLEKYLQIKFGDNTLRVVESNTLEHYAYLTSEQPQDELFLLCPSTFFYTGSEIELSRFIVQVSAWVYRDFSDSIDATIKKFRLPGYIFTIQVIL